MEMPKYKKISEKAMAQEYELLSATHNFLLKQRSVKSSELNYVLKNLNQLSLVMNLKSK